MSNPVVNGCVKSNNTSKKEHQKLVKKCSSSAASPPSPEQQQQQNNIMADDVVVVPVGEDTKNFPLVGDTCCPNVVDVPSKLVVDDSAEAPPEAKKKTTPAKKSMLYSFTLMSNHVVVKKQIKMYRCDVCGATYRHVFSLKRHFLRNHVSFKYISKSDLSNCKINVGEISDMMAESDSDGSSASSRASSSKKRQRISGVSAKREDSNTNNEEHMSGLYRCHLCKDTRFDTKLELKVHFQKHPTSTKLRFTCDKCGAVFSHKQAFFKHALTHADTNTYPCTVCGKNFTSKALFSKHVATHAEGNTCKYCSKVLSTRANKRRHERIHEGLKPYPCKYCNFQFGQSGDLKKHLKKEHGVSYLSCPYCMSMFSAKTSLNKHMVDRHSATIEHFPVKRKIKQSEMLGSTRAPFQRTDRQSTSSFNSHYNKEVSRFSHLRSNSIEVTAMTQSGKKSYSCNICKKTYSTYFSMLSHRRQTHPFLHSTRRVARKQRYYTRNGSVYQQQKLIRKKVPSHITEAEFYKSVSRMIADNLLNHVDGKTWQLSLRQYNFSDQVEASKITCQPPWSSYNFPSDFDVEQALHSKGHEIRNRFVDSCSSPSVDSLINNGFSSFAGMDRYSSLDYYDSDSEDVFSESGEGYSDEPRMYIDYKNIDIEERKKLIGRQVSSVFLCCVCKEKCATLDSFNDHSVNNHPNVLCTYIEIEGDKDSPPEVPEALQWQFLSPTGVYFSCSVPPPISVMPSITCTKCGTKFSDASDLHQHIISCSGSASSAPIHVRKLIRERKIKRTMKSRMNIHSKPMMSFCKRSSSENTPPASNGGTASKQRSETSFTKKYQILPFSKPTVGRPKTNLNVSCQYCRQLFRTKGLLNAHMNQCYKKMLMKNKCLQMPERALSLQNTQRLQKDSEKQRDKNLEGSRGLANIPISAASVETSSNVECLPYDLSVRSKASYGPKVPPTVSGVVPSKSKTPVPSNESAHFKVNVSTTTAVPSSDPLPSDLSRHSVSSKGPAVADIPSTSRNNSLQLVSSPPPKNSRTMSPSEITVSKQATAAAPTKYSLRNSASDNRVNRKQNDNLSKDSDGANELLNVCTTQHKTDTSRERLSPTLEILVNSIKEKLTSEELSPTQPSFLWNEDEDFGVFSPTSHAIAQESQRSLILTQAQRNLSGILEKDSGRSASYQPSAAKQTTSVGGLLGTDSKSVNQLCLNSFNTNSVPQQSNEVEPTTSRSIVDVLPATKKPEPRKEPSAVRKVASSEISSSIPVSVKLHEVTTADVSAKVSSGKKSASLPKNSVPSADVCLPSSKSKEKRNADALTVGIQDLPKVPTVMSGSTSEEVDDKPDGLIEFNSVSTSSVPHETTDPKVDNESSSSESKHVDSSQSSSPPEIVNKREGHQEDDHSMIPSTSRDSNSMNIPKSEAPMRGREKRYKCPYCVLEFAYLTNFRRHVLVCKGKQEQRAKEKLEKEEKKKFEPAAVTPPVNSACLLHLPNKDEVAESMLDLLRSQSRQTQMMKEAKPKETDGVKSFQTYTCDTCHKIFLSLFKLLQHRVVHKLQDPNSEERGPTTTPQDDNNESSSLNTGRSDKTQKLTIGRISLPPLIGSQNNGDANNATSSKSRGEKKTVGALASISGAGKSGTTSTSARNSMPERSYSKSLADTKKESFKKSSSLNAAAMTSEADVDDPCFIVDDPLPMNDRNSGRQSPDDVDVSCLSVASSQSTDASTSASELPKKKPRIDNSTDRSNSRIDSQSLSSNTKDSSSSDVSSSTTSKIPSSSSPAPSTSSAKSSRGSAVSSTSSSSINKPKHNKKSTKQEVVPPKTTAATTTPPAKSPGVSRRPDKKCPICKKVFYSLAYKAKHMEKMHNNDDGSVTATDSSPVPRKQQINLKSKAITKAKTVVEKKSNLKKKLKKRKKFQRECKNLLSDKKTILRDSFLRKRKK